jgi:thioredoxin 1
MTIDTDAQTDLAQKYKITSLPTVLAFKNGNILGKFVGAQPESGVKNFLEKVSSV